MKTKRYVAPQVHITRMVTEGHLLTASLGVGNTPGGQMLSDERNDAWGSESWNADEE